MEGLGISAGKRWPKWKAKLRSPFITVLRVFLGSVLFSAGVAKIANFPLFLRYISLYDLLPPSLVTPTGYLLLSAEISIGALLIIGYFSRGAALLGGILFLTFSMALSSVIWRGLPLEDCGCENVLFKLFGARLDWKAVSLDMVMFFCSLALVRSSDLGYGIDLLRRIGVWRSERSSISSSSL
ncbi:DoxX family membrane protein [Candidatus Poribacteria bacterium]|nr:DoxX family membrane protein [Candidatus Poribacteria bacterium]